MTDETIETYESLIGISSNPYINTQERAFVNTRLKNLNKKKFSAPKALQKINSNNLILHVIKNFTNNEFNNFILPIGHYKKSFENFFKNRKKINGK